MRAKEVYPVSSAKGRLRFPDFFLFKYDLDDRSRKVPNAFVIRLRTYLLRVKILGQPRNHTFEILCFRAQSFGSIIDI